MSAQFDQITELPSWISLSPANYADKMAVREAMFENVFETTIDMMAGGRPLAHIVRDDHRGIDYGAFLRWIHRDPERKKRYYEAQEIGTEALTDEMMTIADGVQTAEDVQRSSLRVETRWKIIKARNKARYGDTKHIELNSNHTISIRDVLEKRSQKLLSIGSIDGEATVVEDE